MWTISSFCARVKLEKPKGRGHLGDLGVNDGIILKLILKTGFRTWAGFIWLRIGSNGGPF
jgi:hypothetical protein